MLDAIGTSSAEITPQCGIAGTRLIVLRLAVTPRLSMADDDWKEQDAVSLLQALARPTALARPAAVNLGKRGQPSQQLAQFHDETPVVVSKCWGHQLSPLTRCNLDFTPGRNHFVRECDSNPRSGLCTDALAS